MSKIQRFSEFQHSISFFNPQQNFERYFAQFLQSDLGKIYQALPWDELVQAFGLQEKKKGPGCIFSPRGKIALMFLKHYAGCSDKRLIEQLNGNRNYQFFCDLHLDLDHQISNYKIVSQVRCELSKRLHIDRFQSILATAWLPYMEDVSCMLVDATCYESDVRYPTNQKLLWESVAWSYAQLKLMCKYLGIALPRSKYAKWKDRYGVYKRKRRKPSKDKRSLTRGLLRLLDKLNSELNRIEKAYAIVMPEKYKKQRAVISKVYQQQYRLFHYEEKPEGRIVSLSKSYTRPIVRGKETKKVEFGPKVNKLLVDGISFIEHISFDNFHEGKRLQSSIYKAQKLVKTKIRVLGADAIYAINENRRFLTSRAIRTDFKRKGRAGKHELHRRQLAAQITKERTSRMEGSFGKEKEHYHLKRIKARTQLNEILWVCFGIHTANALEIGRRISQQDQQSAA